MTLTEFINEEYGNYELPMPIDSDMEDEIWMGDCWLFEMANVAKKETGLKMLIWIDSREGEVQHGPRIKFQMDYGDRVNKSMEMSMTIGYEPHIPSQLIDKFNQRNQLKSKDIEELKRWIKGNRIGLLLCWKFQLTQNETINRSYPISEITDEVIKFEDGLDIDTVDPEKYRV